MPLEVGQIVKVGLKSTIKSATVIAITQKPEFVVSEILEITDSFYTAKQFKIAKFIATYYFASLSQALNLFVPYEKIHQELTDDCTTKEEQSIAMPLLNKEQQRAFDMISKSKTSLLFGVTGSGKTEIFIHLIAKTLKEGKNTLLLMPEISLTPQMQERLQNYFGGSVAIWHSKLSKSQKTKIVKKILAKEVRIVAGARSALFVPLDDVGLIVVDEEHDEAYKAMTTPRYNAKDLAVFIGEKYDAKVLLASATPSLSSYLNYHVIRLKTPYIKSNKKYTFVEGDGIGEAILYKLQDVKKEGEQSIVFLPTRGNFKYLYCPHCAKTHKCPFCSVGMALHRDNKHLRCHYCGYSEPIVTKCLYCSFEPLSTNRMGTKEAIEILYENIPEIKIAQFDKDSITTAKHLANALAKVANREVDVLVGTQMISKGHNYPDITLSVILGLDYILSLADFKARERAVSLLFQIAGRSGRNRDAHVIVQTNHKELFEPYLQDYELFIQDELKFRQDASYPPYSRMARILVENRDFKVANTLTENIVSKLQKVKNIEIVGFGKAPIEKIANRFRFHIILKADSQNVLLKAMHGIYGVGVKIDMDAVDFS